MAFWGLIGMGLALEGIGLPLVAEFDHGGWRTFGTVLVLAGLVTLAVAFVVRLRGYSHGAPSVGRDAKGVDAHSAGRDMTVDPSSGEGGLGAGDWRGNVIRDSTIHVGGEPKPDTAEARTVVDVTPAYLVGLFDEHTDIQANRLLEPYVGMWMRISGRLGDVMMSSGAHFVQVTFERVPLFERTEFFTIYMYFPKVMEDRLAVLPRGTSIAVLGRIESAHGAALHLEDCELEEP